MHRRLQALRHNVESEFDVSVIYVDDGSHDRSREILRELQRENQWITVLFFTRNFGHQLAVTAGMDVANSDFVAIIDGDLQDPPELVPLMIKQLRENGDHIVFGQRRSRKGESRFKLKTAEFFYRIIRRISNLDIPLNTGDFRVMDKQAVLLMNSLREHNRFLRGLAPWTGLRSSAFVYDREDRHAGETKYTLKKMLLLAFNAIVTFSQTPLRLIQLVGITLTLAGTLGFLLGLIAFTFGETVTLLHLLVLLNFLVLGIIVTCIGILGGYVHRIQDEVRGRPLYVLEVDSVK